MSSAWNLLNCIFKLHSEFGVLCVVMLASTSLHGMTVVAFRKIMKMVDEYKICVDRI